MDSPRFRAAAAAEAIAFLLHWSGGSRDRYSLLKMLYLSERKAMEEHNWPIFFDETKCMIHGLVPQGTYDLIKGDRSDPEWDQYVEEASSARKRVFLKAAPRQEHLSDAQLLILQAAFDENKSKGFDQLKRESHSLPEFKDPGNSSIPLEIQDIFRALDKSPEEVKDFEEGIRCDRLLEEIVGDG